MIQICDLIPVDWSDDCSNVWSSNRHSAQLYRILTCTPSEIKLSILKQANLEYYRRTKISIKIHSQFLTQNKPKKIKI